MQGYHPSGLGPYESLPVAELSEQERFKDGLMALPITQSAPDTARVELQKIRASTLKERKAMAERALREKGDHAPLPERVNKLLLEFFAPHLAG